MCAFSLSEVLNVQPTTSTVLTFGPDDRPAAAGRDPWWSSDDSLRPGRTVPCIACGSPDPDCAAHSELHRSYLPDPHWANRDFWPMNPHLGTGHKNQTPSKVRHPAFIWAQVGVSINWR